MSTDIQVVLHKEGYFDRKYSSLSLQNELIYLFKKIYDLNIGFTYTHATTYESRLTFPQIIYKDIHIYRNSIYHFLKILINYNDKETDPEEKLLEKEILTDLQFMLIFINASSHSTSFSKFVGYLFQPLIRMKEYVSEGNFLNEASKKFCITSKEDCFQRIKMINKRIEAYLERLKEKKIEITQQNPFALLLFVAYHCQKTIFKNRKEEVNIEEYTLYSELFNKVNESLACEKNRKLSYESGNQYKINPPNIMEEYFPVE